MKSELHYTPKKYFWRIIQWTSAAVLLVVIVLSSAAYLSSQHILLQKEYDSNKKVFEQVKINIDMMDTMANNLCKSLYVNGDVTAIMFAKEDDVVDQTVRINRIISTFVSANPYIHSITIYNNNLHRFFNAGESLFFDDRYLVDLIAGKCEADKLRRPVYRKLQKVVNGQIVYENVFSYFMYDYTEKTGELNGAIAINVRTDWFLENIRQINMIENDKEEKVFVLDSNKDYIETGQGNEGIKEWLKAEYSLHSEQLFSSGDVNFYESEYNGDRYLVTYLFVDSMDVTIIKVQKLSEVFRSIRNLRMSILIITIVLLVIAFLISSGISKRIYKPIDNLVQLVSANKRQNVKDERISDEISYLSDIYKNTLDKLETYNKERHLLQDIMKQYWLNRLLKESHTISIQKAATVFEEGRISLPPEGKYVVCVLAVDKYKAFLHEYNTRDRELLRFAALNISSEVIGRKYINEGLDMKEDHIALIIGVPENDGEYLQNIAGLVAEAQEYIKEYFKLSFSASISNCTENIKDITSLYNKALENMSYRIKFGYGSFITPEAAKESGHNDNSNVHKLENKLAYAIKSADISNAKNIMKELFDNIASLDYDHILISLMNAASILNNSINELKEKSEGHVRYDFGSICRTIMEKETLSEIYDIMLERLNDIIENNPDTQGKSQNSYIVDAAKGYIQKNYQDRTLSLLKISTVLNISSRRLSKIFKDETQLSISDYINDVRLVKAAELLSTTSMNVNEVVSKSGIENETYFYSMFKKKFGLTPKEYAFKRIVNMARE